MSTFQKCLTWHCWHVTHCPETKEKQFFTCSFILKKYSPTVHDLQDLLCAAYFQTVFSLFTSPCGLPEAAHTRFSFLEVASKKDLSWPLQPRKSIPHSQFLEDQGCIRAWASHVTSATSEYHRMGWEYKNSCWVLVNTSMSQSIVACYLWQTCPRITITVLEKQYII